METNEQIKYEVIKNLPKHRIIELSIRDNEKPMGVLLTYIKDMYGMTKTQAWDIALGVLYELQIDNKIY